MKSKLFHYLDTDTFVKSAHSISHSSYKYYCLRKTKRVVPKIYEHMNISAIAAFLHIKLDESRKKQREIAREIGYDNPNILSMMKHGDAKVPFDKVPALAKALDVDAGHLMRLAIEQYWPGLKEVIKGIFGNVVSENELMLVQGLRVAFRDLDPSYTSTEIEAVIAVLKALRSPPGAAP